MVDVGKKRRVQVVAFFVQMDQRQLVAVGQFANQRVAALVDGAVGKPARRQNGDAPAVGTIADRDAPITLADLRIDVRFEMPVVFGIDIGRAEVERRDAVVRHDKPWVHRREVPVHVAANGLRRSAGDTVRIHHIPERRQAGVDVEKFLRIEPNCVSRRVEQQQLDEVVLLMTQEHFQLRVGRLERRDSRQVGNRVVEGEQVGDAFCRHAEVGLREDIE